MEKTNGGTQMRRKRITRRIRQLALGLIEEGLGYDWDYLRTRVLDENDNQYQMAEYVEALEYIYWKMK